VEQIWYLRTLVIGHTFHILLFQGLYEGCLVFIIFHGVYMVLFLRDTPPFLIYAKCFNKHIPIVV